MYIYLLICAKETGRINYDDMGYLQRGGDTEWTVMPLSSTFLFSSDSEL